MKKYFLFGVIVFAVVLSVKVYFKDQARLKNVKPATRFAQLIGEKVSPQTLPRVQAYVNAAQEVEPETCRLSREKILTQKIEDIVKDIADRRTFFDEQCETRDENLTSKDLASAVYKSCRREEIANDNGRQTCWQALVFFKAALVTKAFGERSVNDADAETLVYLFMDKMTQGAFRTPEELMVINQITDRLVELMPDSPSALKAAALPRIVGDFDSISKGSGMNPEVDEYIEEALRLNPSDSELQEISLFRKLYSPKAEKLSVDKAAVHVENNPSSSLAHYFLAGALSQSGRLDESIQVARRAYEMAPENTRYRETLERLLKGEGKKAFRIHLGVNFDNL